MAGCGCPYPLRPLGVLLLLSGCVASPFTLRAVIRARGLKENAHPEQKGREHSHREGSGHSYTFISVYHKGRREKKKGLIPLLSLSAPNDLRSRAAKIANLRLAAIFAPYRV